MHSLGKIVLIVDNTILCATAYDRGRTACVISFVGLGDFRGRSRHISGAEEIATPAASVKSSSRLCGSMSRSSRRYTFKHPEDSLAV